MLNYANLNDLEFEALCQDVMEQLLQLPLRRFASGRDSGVDLTDDPQQRNVIVQVRHYAKSDTAALIRSLKAELAKIQKLSPKEYYICCSRELSCHRVEELYRHFQPYMNSHRNIITVLEIEDFLKRKENAPLLKKHFKLWIDAAGILEQLHNDSLFVDSEVFLADIAALHKRFVPTTAFHQALACLQENRVLCILGDPGVGKSVTSKMLALTYASSGFRVRYTTDVTDLSALKASLRQDPGSKEIIVLDDCFGQAYFEMKSTQSTELLSLILYVKLHPAKHLILNSRITVYREAGQHHHALIRSLENGDYPIYELDVSSLSLAEKANILYNHLFFSDIPQEYLENLREGLHFYSILTHPNYTPRIMEFVCTPSHYRKIPPHRYYDDIICQLENPQLIWKDEYENHLSKADRILLQTVYSLSVSHVPEDTVRYCFSRRIAEEPSIDKTVDPFHASLARLSENFLTVWRPAQVTFLALRNPSIGDFLDARLRESDLEWKEMVYHIYTVEQMHILPTEMYIPFTSVLLETGAIRFFRFPSEFRRKLFLGWGLLAAKLCIKEYTEEFLQYLSFGIPSPFPSPFSEQDQQIFLENILSPELWHFYGTASYLCREDHLEHLLYHLSPTAAAPFLQKLEPLIREENRSAFLTQLQHYQADFQAAPHAPDWMEENISPFIDIEEYEFCNTSLLFDLENICPYKSYDLSSSF